MFNVFTNAADYIYFIFTMLLHLEDRMGTRSVPSYREVGQQASIELQW